MSDRHNRQILSGRSNRPTRDEENQHGAAERRPATSGGLSARPQLLPERQWSARATAIRERINDQLNVHRPFSPNNIADYRNQLFPPMLPPGDPTIPPLSPRKVSRKPPICPSDWVQKSSQPEAFDRSSMQPMPSPEKQSAVEDFVSRNAGHLWKYDLAYMKKTPRTVCNELVEDPNFHGRMTKLHQKERNLRLSSSDSISKCLLFPKDSGFMHTCTLRKSLPQIGHNDPFMQSISTGREVREDRQRRLFAPAIEHRETRHTRGFKHAPEYGTFSNYNAVLKAHHGGLQR